MSVLEILVAGYGATALLLLGMIVDRLGHIRNELRKRR